MSTGADSVDISQAARVRFPADALKERIVKEPLDSPEAANRYSRRAKKIKDEKYDPVDEPFYDWLRNATSLMDAVVTIEVKPDFGQTKAAPGSPRSAPFPPAHPTLMRRRLARRWSSSPSSRN